MLQPSRGTRLCWQPYTAAGSSGLCGLLPYIYWLYCCLLTAPLQAISRVWRYGQARPCYIYHLLYGGTFETRVFERVLIKEELFQRVSFLGGGAGGDKQCCCA